ncbi:hypothetical protein ABPG75_002732 [Micractinium tetrahymenae]
MLPKSEGPAEGPRNVAEQAIQYLLSRNLLLTALELLQEAGEAGLGHEVESLTHFFKDPALFPSEEVAACNPEDGAPYAQVAHERQQQLSQAQYELALAREQLAALSVSHQATQQDELPRLHQAQGHGGALAGQDSQLSAAELRALHRAVLAHLHAHGFKVAALSLSKEAQLPPADAQSPAAGSLAGMYAAAQQLEAQLVRLRGIEAQAEQQAEELAMVQQELAQSREKEAVAAAEVEFLRDKLARMEQAQQAQQQRQAQQRQHAEQRQLPQASQEHEPGAELGDSAAFTSLGAASALVEVAACMPRVLPNLLINKREELVPALCALSQEHPQAPGRRQLAGLLFGLIKKPNLAQRGMITDACIGLSRRIGPARTMLELVPHLQDQVQHELLERRLLVAEAAGALAPHLATALAAPTMLGLLEALLHDSQPQVRCQALSTLGRLATALGEDTSSFSDVLRLLLAAAADTSSDVTQLLLATTLPAVLEWIGQSELLVVQLLPQTLQQLHHTLEQCPTVGGASEASPLHGEVAPLRCVPANVQSQIATMLQIYVAALPAVREFALRTQPAWVERAAQAATGELPPTGAAEASSSVGFQRRHTTGDASSPLAPAALDPYPAMLQQLAGKWAVAAVGEGVARRGSAPGSSVLVHACNAADASGVPLAQHSSSPPDMAGQPGRASSNGSESVAGSPRPAALQPAAAPPGVDENDACVLDGGTTSEPHSLPAGQRTSAADSAPHSSSSSMPAAGTSQAGDSHSTGQLQRLERAAAPTQKPATDGQPCSRAALRQQLEAAAFAVWVQAGGTLEDWQAVDYMAVSAVPALIKAALVVAPLPEATLLKQRFVAAIKATCLSLGEPFAAAVVVPQLHAAASIPSWSTPEPAAGSLTTSGTGPAAQALNPASTQLRARLANSGVLAAPATSAQQVAGAATALPLLLVGALPYAGASAVGACAACAPTAAAGAASFGHWSTRGRLCLQCALQRRCS